MSLQPCNNGQGALTGGTNASGTYTFTQSGYTLIYCDTPEDLTYKENQTQNKSGTGGATVTALADPSYGGYFLYKDTTPGRCRAYLYANNNTAVSVTLVVTLVNPSATDQVNVFINRKGARANSSAAVASMTAWQDWMNSSGTDTFDFTLNPGQSSEFVTVALATGDVGNIIVDFVGVDVTTSAVAPLEVYMYAYASSPQTLASQVAAPLEYAYDYLACNGQTYTYGTIGFGAQVRGTFAHSSRSLEFDFKASETSKYLVLATRPADDCCGFTPIGGEYEAGTDKVSSVPGVNGPYSVWLYGNYPVDYNFTSQLTNDTGASLLYGYLQPQYVAPPATSCGSATAYVIKEDGSVNNCDTSIVPLGNAYVYDQSAVPTNGTQTHTIQWVVPGGESGHHQFYWAV